MINEIKVEGILPRGLMEEYLSKHLSEEKDPLIVKPKPRPYRKTSKQWDNWSNRTPKNGSR
jgi:hypothetical protein